MPTKQEMQATIRLNLVQVGRLLNELIDWPEPSQLEEMARLLNVLKKQSAALVSVDSVGAYEEMGLIDESSTLVNQIDYRINLLDEAIRISRRTVFINVISNALHLADSASGLSTIKRLAASQWLYRTINMIVNG